MNDEQDIVFRLRMKDEAQRILNNFKKELQATGGVTRSMTSEMKNANRAFAEADTLAKRLGQDINQTNSSLRTMVKEFAGVAAGMASFIAIKKGVGETLNSFMLMEDGMSNVRKTAGLTGADLEDMREKIDAIGRDVPIAMEKLYDFAATAGRAGVTGKEALAEFTKVAAQASIALDGIDPDSMLAVLNTTGEGVKGIKQFAAELNYLDDTSSTSASAILSVANNVSVVGAAFKMNASDVLAFSTVIAEARQEGSAAATAFQRMGNSIGKAVATGGKDLQDLANIAGISTAEFAKLSKQNMAELLTKVLFGLKSIREVDELGYFRSMEKLGVDAEEAQKPVTAVLNKLDKLREAQNAVANKPLTLAKFDAENQAQVERFSAQLQLLKNEWQQLKAAVGEDFAKAALPIIEALRDIILGFKEWYSTLDEGSQKMVAFGTVGVVALGALALTVGQAGTAMRVLAGLLPGVAAGGGAALATLGPIALGVAGVTTAIWLMADANSGGAKSLDQLSAEGVEGAAKLKELRDAAEEAEKAQRGAGTAADGLADRLAYARQHADSTAKALRQMGIEAEWAAQKLALAQVQQARTALSAAVAKRQSQDMMPMGLGAVQRAFFGDPVEKAAADLNEANQNFALAAKATTQGYFGIGRPSGGAGPQGGTGTGGPASAPGVSQKPSGGSKSTAETPAQREVKARAQAYKEMDMEGRKAADMLASLTVMQGKSNDEIDKEKALVDAVWELRKRSGKENAKLTVAERDAVEFRIQKEQELARLEEQRRREAQAGVDLAADRAYRAERATIGFADTKANAVANAILDRKIELKRQNQEISAVEIAQIRESTAAQWDWNEAQEAYNQNKQMAMDGFDIFANTIREIGAGATSLKDIFGNLTKALYDMAMQYLILIPLKKAFETSYSSGGGFFGSLFKAVGAVATGGTSLAADAGATIAANPGIFAKGGAFSGGVQFFANGGVVNRPTAFGMAGGGMGVMGEAGPEAIMPLRRGPNGSLGVQAHGSAAGVVIQGMSIQVTAPEGADPVMLGKVISDAVETRMSKYVARESRPGGSLYRR